MEYLIQPWNHQLEAIKRAKDLPHFALFFEMGAGKTGTAINILRSKYNDCRRILRTLIFCPPIVVSNWRDEWLKHSRIEPGRITLLTGSGRDRLKKFLAHGFGEGPAGERIPTGQVFVTNYESLLMSELYEAFLQWAPEALVLDESHKCKSPTAKRSKLIEALANPFDKKAKRLKPPPLKYILSGSPVLNSPMDLFMQFLILDGGQTFGTNFYAFRARFFRDKNAGMPKGRYFPDWQIMPGALDEMNRLIFRVGMRVEKKDCLDLPPLVRQTIKVPMSAPQAQAYAEMKKDFLTFMGGQAVVATLAITKALRLMQITSGFAMTVEGETKSFETPPKLEALRELLEEITPHSKVLVWCVWRENYAQIRAVCDALGVGCVEVHGDVTPKQKDEAVARFKTDERCRVFIGHPGSGGIGINLVNAPYSIFFSRTFSLEHSLQAEARNHRGGSEIHEKITRIDLVCEGTIDELVQEKLANKVEVSDTVLRDLSLMMRKQES
jgi:SNF2 family DNA or RNA helicase